MSIDYYVYTKDIEKFSANEFFKYASTHGINLRTEEEFNITKAEGFQPFILNVDFIDTIDKNNSFSTGFELYIDEYKHISEQPVKPTFCQKIFKRTPPEST